MSLFQSGNPTLSEKRFRDTVLNNAVNDENAMTVKGTLRKFGFLFLMTLATAFYSWKEAAEGGNAGPLVLTGVIGGLIVALVIIFKKEWSPWLAPLYGLLEGLFLGAVSAFYEYRQGGSIGYPGIVLQAVGLTFCVVAAMYLLFTFRIIKVTQRFRSIVLIATAGIALFYFIILIGNWIFSTGMPAFLTEGSVLGIGFSVFVVALAAMNLVLDFDMIEKAAELLAKLNSRD